MKKVTPSDGLHEPKPIIHDRRWTDGSAPWETLPQRLSTLGKVIQSSQIPWSFSLLSFAPKFLFPKFPEGKSRG